MTTATIKFTGNVRGRIGIGQMDFAFDGQNLGELLEALFARYDLRDVLLDLDGGLKPFARLLVNGRFSSSLQGMQTPIRDGDRVVLMRPYMHV